MTAAGGWRQWPPCDAEQARSHGCQGSQLSRDVVLVEPGHLVSLCLGDAALLSTSRAEGRATQQSWPGGEAPTDRRDGGDVGGETGN